MSVKLMTKVYEAHFHDIEFERKVKRKSGEEFTKKVKVIASNLKSVCLAMADHANDEGEGAYPSISLLEDKTELSRVTVVMCIQAMKTSGLLSHVGRSKKYHTCNYTVNKEKLVDMASWERQKREKPQKDSKAALLSESKDTLPQLVKPLSKTSKAALLKPSFNRQTTIGADAPPATWGMAWQLAAGAPLTPPTEEEQQAMKVANALELFPQGYKAFAQAFILASGIFPISADVSGWCKAFKDQEARTGLAPDDIADACRQMFKDGLTVKDPFSVMNKIANIRASRKQKQTTTEWHGFETPLTRVLAEKSYVPKPPRPGTQTPA